MIITKLKNIVIQIFILNGNISCEPKSDYLLLIEDDVLSKLPSEDFFLFSSKLIPQVVTACLRKRLLTKMIITCLYKIKDYQLMKLPKLFAQLVCNAYQKQKTAIDNEENFTSVSLQTTEFELAQSLAADCD
ncbi:hypothetical protein T4A_12514 [Trichinella pseudospiralis]|uniref:Uncharacterized protein n=1 Tax=Trichinella pseudospiralis TaxID=6337 RepID=A0A0V1JZM6_TRIPS|nr:hypothetical protein T4A_12514 [Trichinella pseudospiralis]KRZ40467.1 hypothetical protein T4C_11916 [Trichinella pseudospiralis]